MLVVNDKNLETVKQLKFALWAFLDVEIDLPLKQCLEAFGHHTSYRYCTRIDSKEIENLSKHKLSYEHRKLLCDNPNVSNQDMHDLMGLQAINPIQNPWTRLMAINSHGTLAESIRSSSHQLRVAATTPEVLREVLLQVKEDDEDDLMDVIGILFSLPRHFDTAQMCVSEIAHRFGKGYLDALVFPDGELMNLINSGYWKKPRIASLLIANGKTEELKEANGITFLEDAMSLNDGINLGLDVSKYLDDCPYWKRQSNFSPITKMLTDEEIAKSFKGTSPDRLTYLGNFAPEVKLQIIEKLIDDATMDFETINHLCFCLLSLTRSRVKFSEDLSDTIVAWAIDTGENRHMWRLYLSDNIPEYLRDSLRLHLKAIY